jgi:hypothetical protein
MLSSEGEKNHDQSGTGVFHLPIGVFNVINLPRRQAFMYLLQVSQSLLVGFPCCDRVVLLEYQNKKDENAVGPVNEREREKVCVLICSHNSFIADETILRQ